MALSLEEIEKNRTPFKLNARKGNIAPLKEWDKLPESLVLSKNKPAPLTVKSTPEVRPMNDRSTTEVRPMNDRSTTDTPSDERQKYDRSTSDERQMKNTYSSLVGNQKSLVDFLYNECKIKGSQKTDKIFSIDLQAHFKIESSKLKSYIYELNKKKIINTVFVKKGNNGWRIFEIPKDIFQEISQTKLIKNFRSTSDERQMNDRSTSDTPSDTPSDGPPYNNNSLINSFKKDINIPLNENPVSKGQLPIFEMPEDWQEIDLTEIENNELIKFKKVHLRTIYKNQLKKNTLMEAEDVQFSLNCFSSEVSNESEKTSKRIGTARPLGFIIGLLSKGNAWTPVSGYEDPVDKALREYQKNIENKLNERKKEEDKTKNLAYQKWLMDLPMENKLKIPFYNPDKSDEKNEMVLKGHFEKTEWAKIFEKIKKGGTKSEEKPINEGETDQN